MIIVYQETPSSLLKAAMLYRLDKGFCISEKSTAIINSETVHCRDCSLETLKKRYEMRFGRLRWLDGKKSRSIASAAYYALRYTAPDKSEPVLKIMIQSLEHGPDFVLSRVSPEARTVFNWARRVCMEIHRAYGFVRLFPVSSALGQIMMARVSFENNIHDLVIRYFTRRQINVPVYLIDGECAYFMSQQKLAVSPVTNLPFSPPTDEFQQYWETYYDSQFIEGRKNLALARKHIPKKLWSWVPEGNKLTKQ